MGLARLVADLTEDQFWEEWRVQSGRGLRLSRVQVWDGGAYAGHGVAQAVLRLHLKILAEPAIPIARMLDRMREVYEPAGFQIEIGSIENVDRPSLLDLEVGSCSQLVITDQQQELFRLRSNADARDVVLYFVRTTLPPYNGCAAHPDQRPGAIIASYATEWTLAHEVGHVLGLYHVSSARRLMTGLGTGNIEDPPPDLLPQEIDTMMASVHVRRL
jgi:hypothetical protein